MASIVNVLFAIAYATLVISAKEPVRYDGYHLLRTVPQTNEQILNLKALGTDTEVPIDFWLEPRVLGQPVDIFVSSENLPNIVESLNKFRLQYQVSLEDVQPLIEQQFSRIQPFSQKSFDWTDFHTIDEINAWLKEQAKKYNKIATLITAGQSYENRTLIGLRIAHKPNLPIVFIEGGIHAREWISPATATWFIQQALNTTDELIKSYEWHVFPLVNPDGYAYTQTDRMWRKTRSPASNNCSGVDMNRNWPFKWQGGSAPCSETHPGERPASEPETQGLITYLKSVADRTRVYVSFHSYSQIIMYPWGYTTELPPTNKRFSEIASKATQKLKARFGTTYKYGPISQTSSYSVFGSTIDYAYSINITYPFVFELRDTGKYGFLMPKGEIIPTATETFDAVSVILEEARK